MKKKVYVLMVAKSFPVYHPRAGDETGFKEKIMNLIGWVSMPPKAWMRPITMYIEKKHTIRANHDLWASRAEKINRGEAVLSLRQWTGSPYNSRRDGSKQKEFLRLEKIGIQKIRVLRTTTQDTTTVHTVVEGKMVGIDVVAKYDGLSVDDFCQWFRRGVNGCVIHFTDFKYT